MIEKMCSRGAIELGLGLYNEEGVRVQDENTDANRRVALIAEQAMLDQVKSHTSIVSNGGIPTWNDFHAEGVDQVRENMLLAAKNLRNSVTDSVTVNAIS